MKVKLFFVFPCLLISSSILAKPVLIISTSYNRPDFIDMQYMTLKKFLKDPYELVVFNDAQQDVLAKQIEATCNRLHVRCIRIPQIIHNLPYTSFWPGENNNHPTKRHTHCVQYALNLLGFNHDGIVVVLDSDVFLLSNFSFIDVMKNYDVISYMQSHSSSDKRIIEHCSLPLFALNMPVLPNIRSLNVNPGYIDKVPCDAGAFTVFYFRNHPNVRILSTDCAYIEQTGSFSNNSTLLSNNRALAEFVNETPVFPINVDLFYQGKFLHHRGGSGWDNKSAQYNTEKTRRIRKLLGKLCR